MNMSPLNRRNVLTGAAALGLAGAGPVHARRPRPPERPIGIWTPLADMPFPVQEIYPAAFRRPAPDPRGLKPRLRSELVNAGGIVADRRPGLAATDIVTIYDPFTNEWRHGPRLPEARHHIALAFNNGYLYAVNGFYADAYGSWQMESSLWRLDKLDGAQWLALTPPPIPQAESVVAALGARLHLVGGRAPSGSRNLDWGDHIDTDLHWAYDAAYDSWYPRRPLPNPRNSAAGAVADGFLFVIGGRTVEGGNSAECDVYEPTADRWQPIAPLPRSFRPRAPRGQGGLAAAVWDRRIYVFGGEWFSPDGGGVYAESWEYDPREDRWRSVAAMPRPRHGLGAVALEDGIYVCGGASLPGANGMTAYLDRFEI